MAAGGARAGAGRQVGSELLAINLEMRRAIIEAARQAGGPEGIVGYLVKQSRENPQTFMALMGKCTSTNSDLKELGDALPGLVITIRDLLAEKHKAPIIDGEIVAEAPVNGSQH